MFYKNPLIYITTKNDVENETVEIQQINNYKYLLENFIQEIKEKRKTLKNELELFCVLGTEEIDKIEEEISEKISKLYEENEKQLIKKLKADIDNIENPIIQRFFDLYISTFIEKDKQKYPQMYKEQQNGIYCLSFYNTNSQKNEKLKIIAKSTIITYLQNEKPSFMGKQIMIQSFLLEDIKNRRILAFLPNERKEWYLLLEGGFKLYLRNENPYKREKITSENIGRWTVFEIEEILNNPCYSYKKLFEPYGLFEEWNQVFIYALATLPIEYEIQKLELLYRDFLKFIEENICFAEEIEEAIIPNEIFCKLLKYIYKI